MSDAINKSTELHETDLEAAAGGAYQFTKNRHDPAVCSTYTQEEGYNCIGPFWGAVCCDHYRTDTIKNDQGKPLGWRKYCVMG